MNLDRFVQPAQDIIFLSKKFDEPKHAYGNTQIQIDPWSSAAARLNMARDVIEDQDLMATGKDVDPNHLTVRYGLLNDDLDKLRDFIANQTPFKAYVYAVELFPASEHSDGAVPVVARISSPELHEIEAEIGKYADFKEKSFPVYKPHCTLAYCKPEAALRYANLFVTGTFLVSSIMISHQSGVKETIPFGIIRKKEGSRGFSAHPRWAEEKHPRHPKGSPSGGEFMSVLHSPKDALDSLLAGEKRVEIDANDVRAFLEIASQQLEDPNLNKLRVGGMQIFGGEGLGIDREHMPQVPKAHRENFLDEMQHKGVEIVAETVDPLSLKPTQNEISARTVGLKLAELEEGAKKFPPLLVSEEGRVLDGHHHWGVMAAFALEFPDAKVPIFRLKISTKKALALMHAYDKKYGIKRKKLGERSEPDALKTLKKEIPTKDRYVTPFVSFDKLGDEQLRMIASLNSSRLATWGFTAEAEARGMARYRLTAVLDGRTSKFCRLIDGKIFQVTDAREKVIEVLNVQNPDDLKVVQPWPKQDKASMAAFKEMSPAELTERGLHIPPYHPHCRTICRVIEGSQGQLKETVATIPAEAEVFQTVTAADLKELGIDATPENVAAWNAHVGMTPVELLSKLTGMPPQEIMTKGKGVGSKPIQFVPSGEIAFKVNGETPSGVEFKIGAILDPFTSIYYLTQADLMKGSPKAETSFLKNMFRALLDMGKKSKATSVAVNVAGNAPYYAKLGFLPDGLDWDVIRKTALARVETGDLKPMLESLAPADQLLVKHLLQDSEPKAMSALVDLPFKYANKFIKDWLFGDLQGLFSLDLFDDETVEQAQSFLGA